MAINNFSGDYINFGNVTQVRNITSAITLMMIINSTSGPLTQFGLLGGGTSDERWWVSVNASSQIQFESRWNTTDGIWHSPTVSGVLQLAITYSNTSTSNNPVIYYNGISQTVSRTQAPSGAYSSGTGSSFYVGDFGGSAGRSMIFQDVRVYNAILQAAQFRTMWNSGSPKLEGWDNNLVFHCPVLYAENHYPTLPFQGTLGNTDFFYDRINGYKGTPTIINGSSGFIDLAFGTGF